MFPRALTLGRVRGVAVRVDPSMLLIVLLFAWTFQSRFAAPNRSLSVSWSMALVGALLFLASVLVHELAHALEGLHRGVEVRSITLFLFGGVTEMGGEVDRARDEFAISAVGPYSSLVIAALLGLAAYGSAQLGFAMASDVLGTIGWLNVMLAVFNLVPGAPLDGGRVLRSAVWAVTGNRLRAVKIASRAGQALALALVAGGGWVLLTQPGALLSGVWLGFIGLFMLRAATAELRRGQAEQLVSGHTVTGAVQGADVRLRADRDLEVALAELGDAEAALVVDDDGEASGVLRARALVRVDPADRSVRRVGDVADPLEELPRIAPDAPLLELLHLLSEAPDLVLVADDTEVRSVLTLREIRIALRRLEDGEDPSREDLEALGERS